MREWSLCKWMLEETKGWFRSLERLSEGLATTAIGTTSASSWAIRKTSGGFDYRVIEEARMSTKPDGSNRTGSIQELSELLCNTTLMRPSRASFGGTFVLSCFYVVCLLSQ